MDSCLEEEQEGFSMGTAVRVLSVFLLKAFRLSLDDSFCQLKSIFSFDFCFEFSFHC